MKLLLIYKKSFSKWYVDTEQIQHRGKFPSSTKPDAQPVFASFRPSFIFLSYFQSFSFLPTLPSCFLLPLTPLIVSMITIVSDKNVKTEPERMILVFLNTSPKYCDYIYLNMLKDG